MHYKRWSDGVPMDAPKHSRRRTIPCVVDGCAEMLVWTESGLCKRHRHQAYPDKHLSYRYKMTDTGYDTLLQSQGGVCAICGNLPGHRKLDVDHDHKCCPDGPTCGQCVRGLLCRSCNLKLSPFEDPEWAFKANQYLDNQRLATR